MTNPAKNGEAHINRHGALTFMDNMLEIIFYCVIALVAGLFVAQIINDKLRK